MSHVVYLEGDGFVIAEVWRAESEDQPYIDDVLRPLLAVVGLTGHATVVPSGVVLRQAVTYPLAAHL